MTLPRFAVVEPHMDDAALSVGGRLHLLRGGAELTLVTATRWSANVRRGFRGPSGASAVTRLRLEEARRAAVLLGAEHVSLDEPDAPLRLLPRERWEDAAGHPSLRAWASFGPTDEEVVALATKLGAAIAELDPDEIWIPLGVGRNLDHWRTRDACLRLLAEDRSFASARVRVYADLPYANRDPAHARQLLGLLARQVGRLRPVAADIAPARARKAELLSCYPSQLDGERAAAELRRVPEGLWELEGQPQALPRPEASPAWRRIEKLRRRIPDFLSKAERKGRITVIAPDPLGRPREAMSAIRRFAPGARLDVHASAGDMRELDGSVSCVHRTTRWAALGACGELGVPTIVASRGFQVVRAALPFRPVLAARFAGEVCLALEAAGDR